MPILYTIQPLTLTLTRGLILDNADYMLHLDVIGKLELCLGLGSSIGLGSGLASVAFVLGNRPNVKSHHNHHQHQLTTKVRAVVGRRSGQLKIRIRILPVRSAEKIRSDHPHFTRYKIRRSAGPQIRILPDVT